MKNILKIQGSKSTTKIQHEQEPWGERCVQNRPFVRDQSISASFTSRVRLHAVRAVYINTPCGWQNRLQAETIQVFLDEKFIVSSI